MDPSGVVLRETTAIGFTQAMPRSAMGYPNHYIVEKRDDGLYIGSIKLPDDVAIGLVEVVDNTLPSYGEHIAELHEKQEAIDKYLEDNKKWKTQKFDIIFNIILNTAFSRDNKISPVYYPDATKIARLLDDKYTYYILPVKRLNIGGYEFRPVMRELMLELYPFIDPGSWWWRDSFTNFTVDGDEYPHVKVANLENEVTKATLIRKMMDGIENTKLFEMIKLDN